MDQQLPLTDRAKFSTALSPPLWKPDKKLFESNNTDRHHPSEQMKHAAAVEHKNDKKGSPYKLVRSQKLHLKELTPQLPKQKKKGEAGKKVSRVSPTNKRKTPSKVPKKEINFEMNEIGESQKNKE